MKIVSEGLRLSTLADPKLEKPLQHLSTLAKVDKNTSAMILLARVLEGQGKVEKALQYYEEVAKTGRTTYKGLEDVDGNVAEAWFSLGRLRAQRQDTAGAEIAYKKAALEHDDPKAFFYLARLCNPSSDDYFLYNSKAASSGIPEAAHNLGIFYLQQSNLDRPATSFLETRFDDGRNASPVQADAQQPRQEPSIDSAKRPTEKRAMALEWFAVAAHAGFVPSQVNLALLLRAQGSFKEGMAWLTTAGGHPDFGAEVERLKASWWTEDVNLS